MISESKDMEGLDNDRGILKPIRGSIIIFFLFIAFAIWVYDDGLRLLASGFFIIMGILFLLHDFYISVVHRPTMLTFDEEGISMRFRWSEPRQIAWDKIEWVHVPDRYDDGTFKVKEEDYLYWIKTSIGKEIRRRHYVAKGRFPCTNEEYWDAQPDGWRKFWLKPRGRAPVPNIRDDILSMTVDEKKR